jgi:UDP-2,3-diacylglucosamine hydrolase
MSHKVLELKEGAFIISDAHFSHRREELLAFIEDIHAKKLSPTQLILMGDIFDALFGGIPYTYSENRELLKLLNDISMEIELIYLEGNHDFNLSSLLPNAAVFPIGAQPVEARYKDKKVYLAHGDFDGAAGYKLYTAFIRNPFVLFILKYIDLALDHLILKKVNGHLGKKDDCNRFTGFAAFIKRRLSGRFSCDYFIEGHFHQNDSFEVDGFTYINLAAFACNQRYFIIEYSQESSVILLEKKFSKGK